LNEVVIDRGNCPYLTELDCFLNGKYFTRARADGLIISTATGSTAYSLSAGGSLLHPEVPAILFTPVCAHSLSFRPMIFPDGFRLHIQVYKHARGTACVTCDGKNRIELAKGDYVEIECSMHPLPSICLDSETEEWFKAVRSGLQWNTRGS
jgi:NAD+ kinase